MEKIFEFDFWSVLISLVYFIAVLVFLTLLLSYDGKVKKNSVMALIWGVGLYYGFFLLNLWLPFSSIPPDTSFYAGIIKDFWNNYDTWSEGVRLYALINYLPIQFSLKYPVIFILINIFFFYCGVILIGKAFLGLMNHFQIPASRDLMTKTLLYASFYPVGWIVIPSLLREGSMIFFFGLTTFLLVRILKRTDKPTPGLKLTFLLSLGLLTLIRPIGGVSYMIAIYFLYLIGVLNTRSLRAVMLSLIPLVILMWTVHLVATSFYDIRFSIEWLQKYRAYHQELFGSQAYGTQLDWSGIWSLIKNVFLLILQYLIAPLPVLVSLNTSLQKIIPSLDALFILVSLVPVFLNYGTKPVRLALWFALILIAVPALLETNINGAFRHRMNAVVLMLPVFAHSLDILIVQITKKYAQQ